MVFDCVGVAWVVFRPGLGVSPSHRLSGEEKAVSGVWSPPTPAPHLQRERERGLNQDREITGLSPLCRWTSQLLTCYENSSALYYKERERSFFLVCLVLVVKTSRQLARTE